MKTSARGRPRCCLFVAISVALAACVGESNHDIVGPFTGPTTRFAIDHIMLPTNSVEAEADADDLDGDMYPDNQLGSVIATLVGEGDGTTHGDDMIGAGVIASSITLQAPDLDTADKAGATYLGADGDSATTMGGFIAHGAFTSNRTRTTRVPGEATLVLPVFADADPVTVELDAMELDLAPDGSGGYNALVRGGVIEANVFPAITPAIIQMIASDPPNYPYLAHSIDANRDGQITPDEVAQSAILDSLLEADVMLFGQHMVSFGFAVHLVPCASGTCAPPPTDTCFDRVRDGDETDVDCGGSCQACPVAPSCTDGKLDGFETDVDCGWNCPPCASGKMCSGNADCTSGLCSIANDICE